MADRFNRLRRRGDLIKDETRALFEDAEIVLEDLGACNDENCTEANCLHVRQRIQAFLLKAATEHGSNQGA